MKPRALLLGGSLIFVVVLALLFLRDANRAKPASHQVEPSAWLNYCHIVGETPDGELLASFSGKVWRKAQYEGSNFGEPRLPENGPLIIRAVNSGKVVAAIPADITFWPYLADVGGTKLAAVPKGPIDTAGLGGAKLSAHDAKLMDSRRVDSIAIWNMTEGKNLKVLPHPWKVDRGLTCVRFTPAADKLACCGLIEKKDLDRNTDTYECIHLWDINTGKVILTLKTTNFWSKNWSPKITMAVWDIEFSPDGKLVTCAGLNGIHIWDATSGRELVNSPSPVWSGCNPPQTPLWDDTGGEEQYNPTSSDGDWRQFTDDSHTLVVGGREGFCLWDVLSSKQRGPTFKGKILNHAVSGKRIAATVYSNISTIKIWNAETGKELGSFTDGNWSSCNAVQFLDQSNLLAVSQKYDKRIDLWDLSTFKQIGSFDGKEPLVVSHDGKQLFTQSADGQSLLRWNVASLRTQQRTPSEVYASILNPESMPTKHGADLKIQTR
jgi:WD40 repeat protein